MKATKQYFPVVLFIMLFKEIELFDFVINIVLFSVQTLIQMVLHLKLMKRTCKIKSAVLVAVFVPLKTCQIVFDNKSSHLTNVHF